MKISANDIPILIKLVKEVWNKKFNILSDTQSKCYNFSKEDCSDLKRTINQNVVKYYDLSAEDAGKSLYNNLKPLVHIHSKYFPTEETIELLCCYYFDIQLTLEEGKKSALSQGIQWTRFVKKFEELTPLFEEKERLSQENEFLKQENVFVQTLVQKLEKEKKILLNENDELDKKTKSLQYLNEKAKRIQKGALLIIISLMMLIFVFTYQRISSNTEIPQYTIVDLSKYANYHLSWLAESPNTKDTVFFVGVPFKFLPGKRAILHTRTTGEPFLPTQFRIKIDKSNISKAHILISASWVSFEGQFISYKDTIGQVVFNYVDGLATTTPLISNQNIKESWMYVDDLWSFPSPPRFPGQLYEEVYRESQTRGTKKAFGFLDLLSIEVNKNKELDNIEIISTKDKVGLLISGITLEK